jgi:sortase A
MVGAVLMLAACGGRARAAEAEAAQSAQAAAALPAAAVEAAAPATQKADVATQSRGASTSASAAESAATPAGAEAGASALDQLIASATAEPKAAPAPLAVGAFASKAILPPERLELPSIGLDTPVIELGWSSRTLDTGEIYSEWEDADNSAGWHKNSLRPGFGGNVVLSGHNNILGAVFRELDLLKRGDPAYLYIDNLKFEYVVEKVLIVPEKFASEEQKQKNFAYIEPTDDERLTLVSCWPRDDNTHRIIVVARPVASSVIN